MNPCANAKSMENNNIMCWNFESKHPWRTHEIIIPPQVLDLPLLPLWRVPERSRHSTRPKWDAKEREEGWWAKSRQEGKQVVTPQGHGSVRPVAHRPGVWVMVTSLASNNCNKKQDPICVCGWMQRCIRQDQRNWSAPMVSWDRRVFLLPLVEEGELSRAETLGLQVSEQPLHRRTQWWKWAKTNKKKKSIP